MRRPSVRLRDESMNLPSHHSQPNTNRNVLLGEQPNSQPGPPQNVTRHHSHNHSLVSKPTVIPRMPTILRNLPPIDEEPEADIPRTKPTVDQMEQKHDAYHEDEQEDQKPTEP